MKKTVLTVLALAVLLTGCAKGADTTDTTNNVQMRVQDGSSSTTTAQTGRIWSAPMS